jgi:hypothetical protein
VLAIDNHLTSAIADSLKRGATASRFRGFLEKNGVVEYIAVGGRPWCVRAGASRRVRRMSLGRQMRSSDYTAVADDTAKDDEATSFLAALPLPEQSEWLSRLRWIRVADRLSENQLLEPEHERFDSFGKEWTIVAAGGQIAWHPCRRLARNACSLVHSLGRRA